MHRMMYVEETDRVRARRYSPPSQVTVLRDLPIGHLLHAAGDTTLLRQPSVAIVGSRTASKAGRGLAMQVAEELVGAGYIVLSGLAAGIDTAAHCAALAAGARTIALIGTDVQSAYPPENAWLQQRIYREHLLLSPFASGTPTRRGNFPLRNRVMARLAKATVVVEAGEHSGTVHQVRESIALGRPVLVHSYCATHTSRATRLVAEKRVAIWNDPRELLALIPTGPEKGSTGPVQFSSPE
jgi:DNA processing protein